MNPVPLTAVLGRADVWRGRDPHTAPPGVASGWRELDAALPGGGWPLGALIEICRAHDGLGELSLLMPALVRLAGAERWIGFVAPPFPLHAPALAQAGLDPERCLVVHAPHGTGAGSASRAADTTPARKRTPTPVRRAPGALWAAEQLLRGGACAAVLAWWDDAHDDPQALRRLQLAAEAGGSLAVLYRPAPAAQRLSPAPLRLALERGRRGEVFKCRGTSWHAGRGHAFVMPDALARHPSTAAAAGPAA